MKKNERMKRSTTKNSWFKVATNTGLFLLLLLFSNSLSAQETTMEKIQKDAPSKWGKWCSEDRIRALNYLDDAQTLRGIKEVETGKRFTL